MKQIKLVKKNISFVLYEGHSINWGNIFEKSKIIFFPHKCKLCIVWNWFLAKIILILQKYLFWDYSKWQQIKQCVPGLNRGLCLSFWWLRSANHMKFTEECVICIEKLVLVKRIFINWLTMGLHHKPELKRQSMEWKHTDFPVKKMFWVQQLVRKTAFYEKKEPITWFPWKRCQQFMQNSPYLLNDPCNFMRKIFFFLISGG